jgi:DNA processing protein
MMPEELCRIALTLVPHIGDVHARILVQQFGSASAVFQAPARDLEALEGIGTTRAFALRSFRGFDQAEQELRFIKSKGIRALFLTDSDYPRRLLHCYDPPALLYSKGTTDLNASRTVAIVGTRKPSDYGRQFTEQLIAGLAPHRVTIVSGLAFGIDALAHQLALRHGLPTLAVVGHGLHTIYPTEHTALAREIITAGGSILSEFTSGTKPDKHHFPLRNRIVAGLCDATVVIETGMKGGSMITARLADSYHRDVFALPGRVSDARSSGCNHLIRLQKAHLLTGADDLLEGMGWNEKALPPKPAQRSLFPELTPEERQIVDLLQGQETAHIDTLNGAGSLSPSTVAAALLSLELQQVVRALPGSRSKLL